MKQVLGRFDAPLPAAETMDPVLYGALAEDRAQEDRTTLPIVPEGLRARGRVVAREPGVLAGAGVFRRVFECLGKCGEEADELSFDGMRDGEVFAPGDEVLRVEGPGRILLTGERTALNFLQRLCAVATATRACVDAAQGKVAICDTRKTTPGLRALEKYAVVVGGGRSHRWSLADMVLVKENHVELAGGIGAAIDAVRRDAASAELPLTVEARTEAEAMEAADCGADRILLDNMEPEVMRAIADALADRPGRPELEASGGMHAGSIAAVADAGVDVVSVGLVTHGAGALDLSFLTERVTR